MISVRDLCLRAGTFSMDRVSFDVPAGGYAVLMGRTGSGKTTILETLCGLIRPLAGSIHLGGIEVTRLKPGERDIGYVPQDRALFNTMSVRDHLAFALTVRRESGATIDRRVKELAELLGIEPLLRRRPRGLSGGESQRVALGRALAAWPSVLLLDEPLSALDDESRSDMHALLRFVRRRTGVTALHVTHHLEDAEQLADQVLLVHNGAIVSANNGNRPGVSPHEDR